MKKRIAILALAITASFVSCGNLEENGSSEIKSTKATTTAVTTTAPVTSDENSSTTTEAAATTAAEEESETTSTASESEEIPDTTANTAEISSEEINSLINAVIYMDRLNSGTYYDETAEDITLNGSSATYRPITGCSFTSADEIRKYMQTYFTADYISSHYPAVVDGDEPRYIDIDGKLCSSTAPHGGKYGSSDGSATKVYDIDGSTAKLDFTYADYGSTSTVTFSLINDGSWKING